MGTFDTLMKRNKDFAVEQSASGLLMPALPRALPNVKALIIGCADMRVDPAHAGESTGELRRLGQRRQDRSAKIRRSATPPRQSYHSGQDTLQAIRSSARNPTLHAI